MHKRDRALDLFQEAYERQMNGDFEAAISLYKKSLAADPTAEAHTFLGWTYASQKRYAEAIHECKKAIAADPEFGNPWNDIGAYLIEEGRHAEAIPYLKRALAAKRYEAYHYPHYNLGRVFEKKGLWPEAMHEYREALRIDPEYAVANRAILRLHAQFN